MTKCKRCGYEWTPKKANPRSCPYCKSYKWNEAKQDAFETTRGKVVTAEEYRKIEHLPIKVDDIEDIQEPIIDTEFDTGA